MIPICHRIYRLEKVWAFKLALLLCFAQLLGCKYPLSSFLIMLKHDESTKLQLERVYKSCKWVITFLTHDQRWVVQGSRGPKGSEDPSSSKHLKGRSGLSVR